MSKFLFLASILALLTAPALALTASKDGTPAVEVPGPPNVPSDTRADFEYNTGGAIDFVPDMGGSATGWAEWFVTTVYNNTSEDLKLVEFGFPCGGPATGTYGWIVWTNMGGYAPPAGAASTAEYYGSFVPTDPDPLIFPPTTYSYIDVSAENIIIAAGTYFCFGYDNTGHGGMTTYNGVETWGWYGGAWDSDSSWGRTAILQVKADYDGGVPADEPTWSSIKALYR